MTISKKNHVQNHMRNLAVLIVLSGMVLSCSSSNPIRKLGNSDVIWKDTEDFRVFTPPPSEYKAATIWDGADELLLRGLPNLFKFDASLPAQDVNSMDEVPDSSWFTNRMRREKFTPSAAARGACDVSIDPKGPFEVLSSKPDGFNPGFLVRAKDGRKYFFKFDQHELQPERMSSAEVIGSLIYHSIGFTVPCYEVIYFDHKVLTIAKDATMKNARGEKVPLSEEVLTEAFRLAKFSKDGKVRAVSSLVLEGKSLGPWRYEGTVSDDPNDVIAHEERRELRSGYVLASWINHFDTRDQNTLRTWMTEGGSESGFVRHNILDFGDSLGNLSEHDDVSRRLGHSYYFDFPYMVADLGTLGIVQRPWDKARYGLAGPVLGYYNVTQFNPRNWKPGYPNPAFKKMTEKDGAWMARLIAEFTDEHLNAIVERAKIENPKFKSEVLRTLKGRRKKLLESWFREVSPLTEPIVENEKEQSKLCLRDLAVSTQVLSAKKRKYQFKGLGAVDSLDATSSGKLCVNLTSLVSLDDGYAIVAIRGISPQNPNENPVRVHLQKSNEKWVVVGVDRI